MEARMKNPVAYLPSAMAGIQSLIKATHEGQVQAGVLELVHLRVSQINGCSSCVVSGTASARKAEVTDERLAAVAAWRDTPYFTEAERAALALAEAATRIQDSHDPVPDRIWAEACAHFSEGERAGILLEIALANFFNRLNIPVRQQAGGTW